jgi:hypothetical protein
MKIRNPRYSQWDGRRELFEARHDNADHRTRCLNQSFLWRLLLHVALHVRLLTLPIPGDFGERALAVRSDAPHTHGTGLHSGAAAAG